MKILAILGGLMLAGGAYYHHYGPCCHECPGDAATECNVTSEQCPGCSGCAEGVDVVSDAASMDSSVGCCDKQGEGILVSAPCCSEAEQASGDCCAAHKAGEAAAIAHPTCCEDHEAKAIE